MHELDQVLLHQIKGGFCYAPFFWGAVFGGLGYTVSNKYDFHVEGFVIATLGGGLVGALDPFGKLGRVFQLVTVAVSAEIVSYIQTHEF